MCMDFIREKTGRRKMGGSQASTAIRHTVSLTQSEGGREGRMGVSSLDRLQPKEVSAWLSKRT